MEIKKRLFGQTKTGEAVFAFTLKNSVGTEATILTYGAAVQSLKFAGTDVVLGYDTMPDYEAQDKFMGAVAGRFANLYRQRSFRPQGCGITNCTVMTVQTIFMAAKKALTKKSGQQMWRTMPFACVTPAPNGEEGYPGTLCTEVRYRLDDENRFCVEYQAVCDTDTVLNLTNHSYFNLNGHDAGTLEQQKVQIFADFYTENSNECLPTGVIAAVEGTPMDFREPHEIMERIDADFVQLKNGSGYDHNWIPNGYQKDMVRKCAEAVGEETGIRMAVYSDQPGVQFYSGNFLDSIVKGKNGAVYGRRSGFCFETQGFPNATAYGHFPSAVLRQGEWFRSQTIFAFSKD